MREGDLDVPEFLQAPIIPRVDNNAFHCINLYPVNKLRDGFFSRASTTIKRKWKIIDARKFGYDVTVRTFFPGRGK